VFKKPFARLLPVLCLVLLMALPGPATGGSQPVVNGSADVEPLEAFRSSPVMFIENAGQWDARARFQVRGGHETMWLAEDAIWITVVEPTSPSSPPLRGEGSQTRPLPPRARERRQTPPSPIGKGAGGLGAGAVHIKLSFVGANPHPRLDPFDPLDTVVSYFIGNDPAKWQPDVPVWGGMRYVDLYPGVDLEVTSEGGQLVQRLAARPGVDLATVQLRVEGADAVTVNGDALRLSTAAGELTLPLLRGDRLQVAALKVQPRGTQAFDVATPFAQANSDGLPHIANPQFPADNSADLLYGTFLGGSSWLEGDLDEGYAIALDEAGSAFVTGQTESADFPSTPGAFDTSHNRGYADAFVIKLNPTGAGLVYATFLGGGSYDYGHSIAVDGTGSADVTGATFSANFPTTPGAFDRSLGSESNADAFVIKLNPAGSGLVYATFLGGDLPDGGNGIAVDEAGHAYVTGETASTDFPTTPGAFDTSYDGGYDAFIVKLNPAGSALAYATFLGGGNTDQGSGIAVDGTGSAYMTGYTSSTDIPTTPGAFDTSYNSGTYSSDAFVAKLNPVGSGLAYATFLGGSDADFGESIAVDRVGSAFVTGYTYYNFPTTPGAFDTGFNGLADAFVAKLNPAGSGLVYATLLGAGNDDWGLDIAVDATGSAYVTGCTFSEDFPTTPGAFDTSSIGDDAFVVKLNPAGSALAYATFLGGGGGETGSGIAVNAAGSAYVTGITYSTDFPTTLGAFDRSRDGSCDAFVVKLPTGPPPPTYTISGRTTYADGSPISGVTVSAGAGRSAVSDGSGNYTSAGLPAGMYTLAPSKSGYVFSPPSRSVTVPPDLTGVDFVGAVTITDVEINQVLGKQLNGEKNFVAGKDTAIRVLLSGEVTVNFAAQQLVVRREDVVITTLHPAERAGTQASILTFLCDRAACDDWQAGEYAFEATVNGVTAQKTASLKSRREVRLLAVPIQVDDIPLADSWRTADTFLRHVYPIASDGVDWIRRPESLDASASTLQGPSSVGRNTLLLRLSMLQPLGCGLLPGRPLCYDKIIGFIAPMKTYCTDTCAGPCACVLGWANKTLKRPAVVMVNGEFATGCTPRPFTVGNMYSVVAHEVGHTFGFGEEYDSAGAYYRCDVNPPPKSYPTCGVSTPACPDSPEDPWPDGGGTGSLVSAEAAHPFEVFSTVPGQNPRYALKDAIGFMGSGRQEDMWVSQKEYHLLYSNSDLLPATAQASSDATAVNLARVSGWISSGGHAVLEPAYTFEGEVPALATGSYSVEAIDGIGNVLATQQFDVSFNLLSDPPLPVDPVPFEAVLAMPAGASALRVRHGEAVLAQRAMSAHSPTVSVTAPASGAVVAGETAITWQAEDEDGDELQYIVEYSHNGMDWLVLDANITATQTMADFDLLPGGAEARVRVTATDGISTTQATSHPFTVARKPPEVIIESPAAGSAYLPGTTIAFAGRAYDPQEGWLSDDSGLVWSSDRDGALGAGALLYRQSLSPGAHTITLTATDRGGLSANASVGIYVGANAYLPVVLR
jgi:hypothetical protein